MTRTISLITATVGAALLFAVPAWGDSWGADQGSQPVRVSPDLADRAITADQNRLSAMLDARERGLGVTNDQAPVDARSDGLNRIYGLGEYSNMLDIRERGLVEKQNATKGKEPVAGFDARSDGMNRLYGLGEYASPVVADFDRFRIDHSNDPVTVSATSSGRDFEWPTIGIGFGIGIVLLLGLTMALRATHTRPFAH